MVINRTQLFKEITEKQSYLCVGLDPDIQKIPTFLLKEADPLFEFNRRIIDATEKYCVAYKPNLAFYECHGTKGWESLQKTLEYIPSHLFTIADAKRGDIGNTSELYAKTFFDKASSGLDFHSVTVAPYMGIDSVTPFLKFEGKWVILLALTSNEGGRDFQFLQVEGEELYKKVLRKATEWATPDQLMFVAGATRAELFTDLRHLAKDYFFLVPGIGAQGGDLRQVSRKGMNAQCGLLVNSSRNIIYAGNDRNFAGEAAKAAENVRNEMKICLDNYLK